MNSTKIVKLRYVWLPWAFYTVAIASVILAAIAILFTLSHNFVAAKNVDIAAVIAVVVLFVLVMLVIVLRAEDGLGLNRTEVLLVAFIGLPLVLVLVWTGYSATVETISLYR